MRMKRFLAGLLCFCLIGTSDVFYTRAETQNSQEINEEGLVKTDDTELLEEGKKEAETSKTKESDIKQSEIPADEQGEAVQKEEINQKAGLQDSQPQQETGEEQEKQALLNYAVVGSPKVMTPGVQKILLSIGEENAVIEKAVLSYLNETTGKTYNIEAQEISQNAVLFSMDFPQGSETGSYLLTGVKYQADGREQELLFKDAGMEMRFGVDTEVTTNPDSLVVQDEEANPDIDIVTIDEDGNTASAQNIDEAIQNAASDMAGNMSKSKMSKGSTVVGAGQLVVVLDPGHDDSHGGASGSGLLEKDLNLKIAKYCKSELETYSGVKVYMTRSGGACPNGGNAVTAATCNAARVDYAASVGASVYVSIHNNAGGGVGSEVYYPNANYRPDLSTAGKNLAQNILDKLVDLGLADRGIKIRNSESGDSFEDGTLMDYYGVIRRCKNNYGIPAIIVEHAFVDSSDAQNFLNSDAKLKKLGVADATGIANCYGLQKTSSVPKISSVKSSGSDKLKISWGALSGASSYEVYRSKSKDTGYGRVAIVSGTSYTDGVTAGTTYYYKLRAVLNGGNKSSYSSVVSGKALKKPTAKTAKSSSKGITVTWNKVSDAARYEIYRKKSGESSYKKIKTVGNVVQYTDTSAVKGQKYSYSIKAKASNGGYGSRGNVVSGIRLKTPTITKLNVSVDKVKLSWGAVSGADSYQVFRSTSKNGTYKKVKSTTGLTYTDSSAKNSSSYYYKVRAVKKVTSSVYGYSAFCTAKRAEFVKAPTIKYVGSYRSTKIRIKWSKVEGASSYRVYRSTSKNGTYTYVGSSKTTSYINTKVKAGKTYYYKVQAVVSSNGVEQYSAYSGVKSGKTMAAPSLTSVRSVNSSTMEVKWNKVANAKKYQVYRSDKNGSYKKVAEVSGTDFRNTGLTKGKVYYYKIRAINSTSGVTGYSSYSGIKSDRVLKPVELKKVNAGTTNKVALTWNKVTGAGGYQIYRSTSKNGTYRKIASITKTSYDDRTVTGGQTYYYRVRAIKKQSKYVNYGSMSSKAAAVTLDQVRIKSLSVGSQGGMKITWGSVKNASQYIIARSKKKDSGYQTIKTTSSCSFEDNTTSPGTNYYYKVRAVKSVNGQKNYGTYSASKSATAGYTIMGASTVTVQQMVKYYNNFGRPYPAGIYGPRGAGDITQFCNLVLQEANAEGVRAEVLFAQICLETGFLQFGGDVQASQCNFGGLGATGGGVAGNVYPNVQIGIRAQVQHLKAYGSTAPLNQGCVDDRFKYVQRGSAPIVEWLGIPDNPTGKGWAAAQGYGYNLVNMIRVMKKL